MADTPSKQSGEVRMILKDLGIDPGQDSAIRNYMKAQGYSDKSIRSVERGFRKYSSDPTRNFVLGDDNTFRVFNDKGTDITRSGRNLGNSIKKNLGDVVGLGNDVSRFMGIVQELRDNKANGTVEAEVEQTQKTSETTKTPDAAASTTTQQANPTRETVVTESAASDPTPPSKEAVVQPADNKVSLPEENPVTFSGRVTPASDADTHGFGGGGSSTPKKSNESFTFLDLLTSDTKPTKDQREAAFSNAGKFFSTLFGGVESTTSSGLEKARENSRRGKNFRGTSFNSEDTQLEISGVAKSKESLDKPTRKRVTTRRQ